MNPVRPMRWFHDIPIRRKQVLVIMLTSTVALVLACAAFMVHDTLAFRREMGERLASLAGVTGNNLTAAIDFNDPAAARETLDALRAVPAVVHAHVRTPDSPEFATYLREGAEPPRDVERSVAGEVFHGRYLHLFRPIERSGETIGMLEVVADLDDLHRRLWRYAGIAGAVLAASLLLVYVLSARLERLITGPILELTRLAHTVATKRDYAVRVGKRGADEIGQLIDAFNEMLAQIQSRDDALQKARDFLEERVAERTAALKQAQDEAAREQARFKFIFESVPVGISWFVPEDEATHLVNPAHERITGVSAEASRRPGAFALVSHPDDYRRQQALTARFVAGEIDQYSLEERYLHPDGRVVWAVLTSRMFSDPATGHKQSVTTLVDISELKETEAELAYERDLLRALLDGSPDAIYFKDTASRILRCSASLGRSMGHADTRPLIGKTDMEIFGPEVAIESRADEEQIIRTGQPIINKTERTVRPGGTVVWTLTTKMPLRSVTGEIIGTMGISKDITPIKQAEEQLEAVHKQLLETSRQAGMAEVATGVLHNVGNVLNSVNVSATLVAEQVRHSETEHLARVCKLLREHEADIGHYLQEDPQGRQVLQFLEKLASHLASERAENLAELDNLRKNVEHIKEIVAMQQSYARVSGLEETLPLHEIVEDALRMNAGALSRHEISLVRDYRIRPTITVERHKVLQILVNLVRNAKYACDDAHRVDKQVTVRIDGDDRRVRVAVIDNGIGISPENLTRIFSHGFTTRKNGHGFGLHSGALAARQLGGALLARSDGPGQGATFILELPYTRETTAA